MILWHLQPERGVLVATGPRMLQSVLPSSSQPAGTAWASQLVAAMCSSPFCFVSLRARAFWKADITTELSHALQLDTLWVGLLVCAEINTWHTHTYTPQNGPCFAHGKIICLFSAVVCMRHSHEPWPPPILWLGQQMYCVKESYLELTGFLLYYHHSY